MEFRLALVLLSLQVQCSGALSLFPSTTKTPPIKKVAVVGSGIAGLSLAHALDSSSGCANASSSSSDIETHVFDSRDGLNFDAGAGIQFSGGTCT